MERAQLAQMIDHTLLKPEANAAQVQGLVNEARDLGTYSVCLPPNQLPLKFSLPEGLHLAAVCGFPSGAHLSEVKALEASKAVEAGATEIDMVVNLSALKNGNWDLVGSDILAVREAMGPGPVLKVIIESAALSDAEIVKACQLAVAAGGDFVKTSTGFHPAGGASIHAVKLMREAVGPNLGVKASGGIRTLSDALAMIDAGANRLGLSASAAILAELPQ